jgi:hypothetical protein
VIIVWLAEILLPELRRAVRERNPHMVDPARFSLQNPLLCKKFHLDSPNHEGENCGASDLGCRWPEIWEAWL